MFIDMYYDIYVYEITQRLRFLCLFFTLSLKKTDSIYISEARRKFGYCYKFLLRDLGYIFTTFNIGNYPYSPI